MLKTLENIFKIPELRRRIGFTLILLVVFSFGLHIPTPGVNSAALSALFESNGGTLFNFFNLFTGGALSQLTIFGLGVMPYISASILMELMSVVIPRLAELKKTGTEGREVITRYTRYLAVVLAFSQGFAVATGLSSFGAYNGQSILLYDGLFFTLLIATTLTTGTIFLMWLGEKITIHGVGNGMSMLILAGILSQLPRDIMNTYNIVNTGELGITVVFLAIALLLLVLTFVVFIESGQRRVPIQYVRASGMASRANSSYLPLKVNISGVIAIIFSSALLSFPMTVATFSTNPFMQQLAAYFNGDSPTYYIVFASLIIFFSFVYTAIIFNPDDLAENIQKSGGVVPGYRPGENTAFYLNHVITRLTFVGALYTVAIAIIPQFLLNRMGLPIHMGGTTILILVSVSLDTLNKVESHMLSNHYTGFLKKSSGRGYNTGGR